MSTAKPRANPRRGQQQQQQQQGQAQPAEGEEQEEVAGQRFLFFQAMPSWATSFIFHIILIVILALIPILLRSKKTIDIYSGEAATAVESPSPVNFDSPEVNTDELEGGNG